MWRLTRAVATLRETHTSLEQPFALNSSLGTSPEHCDESAQITHNRLMLRVQRGRKLKKQSLKLLP